MYKERLRFERTKEDIKSKEISELLKINCGNYCHYENEYKIMPMKHLTKICDYLNISLDYVFELAKETNYNNSRKDYDIKLSASRIKEIRENKKISQEVLARILKDKRTNIAGYESGKYLIPTDVLYTICKKYHISADYLLGKIDSPKYLNSTKK